jgi:DNA-binding IclR family transcriptional regulator
MPSGLTLAELTHGLGLPKTTVYRLLQALVKHNFLRKDDLTKVYRLGPALLILGVDSRNQWDAHDIALPHLRQLARAANETVALSVLHRDTAFCLETVESGRSTPFWVRIGREMEFHCTAAGKVILAHQPDEEIDRILRQRPLTTHTSRTITDVSKLKKHLEQVRLQGYALCDGEVEVGVRAIAAAIMQRGNRTIGSVTIIAPAERLDKRSIALVLPHLRDTVRQISTDLGYRPARSEPANT